MLKWAEQALDLSYANEATKAVWPLPVYQPVTQAWPQAVSTDEKGISLTLGLDVAARVGRRAEAEGIAKLFGAPGPIVTSTKGVTGHALGAAGALEAIAVVLSMGHGLIPPTDGLEAVDPELPKIDLVEKEARAWTPAPSLSNSFGFGGHNGTLVLAPAS